MFTFPRRHTVDTGVSSVLIRIIRTFCVVSV